LITLHKANCPYFDRSVCTTANIRPKALSRLRLSKARWVAILGARLNE
jgi:hypothetical protein